MAQNKIVALDIGTQTINGAVFSKATDGGVTLLKYAQSRMLGDPTSGGIKSDQVRLAITEILGELGEKNPRVCYTISGQSVFTRFITLPPVEDDKMDQIVEFEAQQIVPFPISEVVWDYQIIGDPNSEEKEAAIIAIKNESLNETNEMIEEAGATTDFVDVAPMALINAFRSSYPDIIDPVLIVDVGATATNLIFLHGKKIFTRTASIGGAHITSAIGKEFNLPFIKAEQSKINEGYVSMGPAYEDDEDEARVALSRVIRASLSRLNSEISRTISYYRTQQEGEQPTEAFLSGGTVATPYFREFIEEKIGVPVRYLNPFYNIGVADTVDTDEVSACAHELGEVIGLAVRDQDNPDLLSFDLPPDSVVRRRDLAKRKPTLLAAAGVLLLALLIPILYFLHADSFAKTKNKTVLREKSQIEPIAAKIRMAENRIATRNQESQPLVERLHHNYEWLKLLGHLNQQFESDYLWFTSLVPMIDETPMFDKTGISSPSQRTAANKNQVPMITKIKLEGLYRGTSANPVNKLYNKLEKSEWFNFEGQQRNKILLFTQQPDDSKWAYAFEFRLPLAAPLPSR